MTIVRQKTFNNETYLGNNLLKGRNVKIEWTEELLHEFIRCKEDPIYFAENYVHIIDVDKGFLKIRLYDYQKEIIEKINSNRKVVVCASRQSGKCVIFATPIRVKNKHTGEILETTIGEFYEMQKNA